MTLRQNPAFTLVELMVTVVIVGILAAVGVASYSKYALKAKMAEAYTGLDTMSKGQAQFYLDHKEFAAYASESPLNNLTSTLYANGYYLIKNNAYSNDVFSPFPVGTKVTFFYQALPGKTNGAGEPVLATKFGSLFSNGGEHGVWGGRDTFCRPNFEFPEIENGPHYSRVYLIAARDFDLSDEVCTRIHKLVDTDERGNIRMGTILTYNLGS